MGGRRRLYRDVTCFIIHNPYIYYYCYTAPLVVSISILSTYTKLETGVLQRLAQVDVRVPPVDHVLQNREILERSDVADARLRDNPRERDLTGVPQFANAIVTRHFLRFKLLPLR